MPFSPSPMSDAFHGPPPEPRLEVMAIVLVISLLAVSFPGISQVVPRLRIPAIFFFIGKHFGTGVILATAFIHLLQDSFESLEKRAVKEHFNHIGEYTGLIILASLLTIFLIEYFCNSYVDHLHAEPSQPSSPAISQAPSRERSPYPRFTPAAAATLQVPPSTSHRGGLDARENTPLLVNHPRLGSAPVHSSHPNLSHHVHLPPLATQNVTGAVPFEVLTNSPRILKMRGCTCVHSCACAPGQMTLLKGAISRDRSISYSHHASAASISSPIVEYGPGGTERIFDRGEAIERDGDQDEKPSIGRRRQVIGLLVLQLGIMIHSFVIGLTLAITTGSDFTSLTVAVVFHQLFEGLSLGIRIASLPSPPSTDAELSALGIKRHSRGLLGSLLGAGGGLKIALAILFGVTAPAGMGIGLILFKVGEQKEGIELARMYLTQGVMSAISAGMLIYASTVEMIAGDFVFGDVEGHSHDHGHSHDLAGLGNDKPTRNRRSGDGDGVAEGDEERGMNDMSDVEDEGEDDGHDLHELQQRHGKVGKKVLAVLSLLAGVGGMVIIGLGE